MTNKINRFTAPAFCNMHVHFRGPNEDGGADDPSMMHKVVNQTTRWCDHALVMPNPDPPILSGQQALDYYDAIMRVNTNLHFRPVMSIQLTESTTTGEIEEACQLGIRVVKGYPFGMTHNSQHGIQNYWSQLMRDRYQALSDRDMVLSLHPEFPDPDLYWEDREKAFVERVLWWLADQYPALRIAVEHISSAWTVNAVRRIYESRGKIIGGFTPLHILTTANDVVGGRLGIHYFCKPMAKRPEDRAAIQAAVLAAEPWVECGTDSAPHLDANKACDGGRAGSFQDYTALQLLTEFLAQNGRLDRLPHFGTHNATKFYDLPRTERRIKLVKRPWTVEPIFRGVAPLWAGKEISWQVEQS